MMNPNRGCWGHPRVLDVEEGGPIGHVVQWQGTAPCCDLHRPTLHDNETVKSESLYVLLQACITAVRNAIGLNKPEIQMDLKRPQKYTATSRNAVWDEIHSLVLCCCRLRIPL